MGVGGVRWWCRFFLPLHAIAVIVALPLFVGPSGYVVCIGSYLNVPVFTWFLSGAPPLGLFVVAAEWYLIASFWLVLPLLVIEDLPIVAALRRAVFLADNNRGAFFASANLVALFGLLLLTGASAFGFPFPLLRLVALLATTLQAALLAGSYAHVRKLELRRAARKTARVFE